MKLVKAGFEIIEQAPGLTGMKRQIELAGRTCYKSLDKITEDSADGFVQRMADSHHYAMLEHGTVYLTVPKSDNIKNHIVDKYSRNRFSVVKYNSPVCDTAYITTNYRVIVENSWQEDLQYMVEPTEYHERRYTVIFTTNRQVTHEFVRHRVFSFAQESTRYCNYTKGKFGSELTFIVPCWEEENTINPFLIDSLSTIEKNYFSLIENYGYKPQQAATILPNATKAEIVMTGFASDWVHFFELRALGVTGAPHPQAQEVALPLMEEFIKRGYIQEIRKNKE